MRPAPSGGALAVTPGRILTTFSAFIRRDWISARSYRLPFVVELTSNVFGLVLFYYLSRLVDRVGVHGQGLQQGYFAFAIVGQALLRIVQSGLGSFAGKLRTEQTTGTLEALLAAPAPPSLLILASAAYDMLFAWTSAAVLLAGAILLGMDLHVSVASAAGLLVAVPAVVVLFVALGVAVAAFIMVFKQGASLLVLITSGLALLGGVYFPVELFPGPLRAVADALPFTWGLDVLRTGLLLGDVKVARLLLLVISAACALPASLWLFRAAVNSARRSGTLAQY